jgi:hypothetical protein
MATAYIRPTGAGDETSITYQYPDSTYHWDKVDEVSPDDGGTDVYEQSTGFLRDLYALEDPSLSGTINWIKVWIRCKGDSPGNYAKTSIKTGGTIYDVTKTITLSWADYSTQYTENPQAGGAWTWAQINALQAGVSLVSAAGKDYSYCTQVYVEIDYTPPGDTSAFFQLF